MARSSRPRSPTEPRSCCPHEDASHARWAGADVVVSASHGAEWERTVRQLLESGIPVKDTATEERFTMSIYQVGKAQERNIEENGDVVWPHPDGTLRCAATGRIYVLLD